MSYDHCYATGHCVIAADNNGLPGRGIWKLNSMLYCESIVDQIRS
jgi:hypothetical protein